MRGGRRRSWIGALAVLLGAAAAPAPAQADEPPPDSPASPAADGEEAERLEAAVNRLYRQGRYDQALPLALRALSLREQTLGAEHPKVAARLNDVAVLYQAKGDYARVESLYERALRIREKALGPDDLDVAVSLNNLATLYQQEKGDYARAAPLFERSLRIRERALGPDLPKVAVSLNNLAALYVEQGDYARAEPLYERALRLRESAPLRDDAAIATALNNLALLYKKKGDYGRAEPLYERALRLREGALGPEHPAVATSLNNLASLYCDKGDYARAEPLYERALRLREGALGPEHPDVATSLSNLASLYQARGEHARAEPLRERELRISERALGPDHPDVAISLSNLALLYKQKGEYTRAAPLADRALRIAEKARGPDHPDVAIFLSNLAGLYRANREYARAEPLYERALRIQEKALDPNHPDIAITLSNRAAIDVARGRLADAVRAEERSTAIEDRNATLILAAGSEIQKRHYMSMLAGTTAQAISLHVLAAPSDALAARLALTTLLRRKGRVLDATADGLAALRRHLTREDQALFDRLSAVKSELGAALWRGPGKLSAPEYRNRLERLDAERERLDREIGNRSAEFRAELASIRLEQVQEAIPDDAALVEFLRYQPFDPQAARPADTFRPARYVAYVLRRSGEPLFADLGAAAPLDAAIRGLRVALADPDLTHNPKPAARVLDAFVMQPIRALVGETRRLLLSPDDALNMIPFESLVDEAGRYLIEHYAFTYLSSGRDLLRLKERAAPRQGAVVVANPDFGAVGASGPSSSGQVSGGARPGRRSVDMTRARFTPLPGTAEEARAVARALPDAELRTAAEATEGAVKAVRGPRILHLATHGFFLADQPDGPLPIDDHRPSGFEPTPQAFAAVMRRENPLLRAGLAFAGANGRASGDKDDGILTALEASGLDLYGTRLVVLSACETGVGEAVSGEGVYGMRRALFMAGAETQVMSLWEVDSGATRRMMTAYYEELNAGAGRSEALRRVQLAMLSRRETSHPNLWASFIVSGDWRTLEGAPGAADLRAPPGPRGCACAQVGGTGIRGGLGAALAALALWSATARPHLRLRAQRDRARRRGNFRHHRRGVHL